MAYLNIILYNTTTLSYNNPAIQVGKNYLPFTDEEIEAQRG